MFNMDEFKGAEGNYFQRSGNEGLAAQMVALEEQKKKDKKAKFQSIAQALQDYYMTNRDSGQSMVGGFRR